MSSIIDLDEDEPTKLPHGIKLLLRSIFKSSEIICRDVVDEGKCIIFFVKPSKTTYRLSTIWKFNLSLQNFWLQVEFYNRAEDDLLRAYTNRMKIQLSILTRMINDYVKPNYLFLVDSQSGVLKLVYNVKWSVFNEKAVKKQNIYHIIMDIFAKFRKYDQLITFVEPMFNFKQNKKQQNPAAVVNRLRSLLKNTRSTRLQLQGCIGDLLRIKQAENRQMYHQQFETIGSIYMRSIFAFQKSTLGLQDTSKFSIDTKIYKHQLRQIQKNQKGITNNQRSSRQTRLISSDRILLGLHKIEPIKQVSEKPMVQEGAHSQVHKKIFKFVIADTIYAGTVSLMNQNHWIDNRTKEYSTELAYKNCNSTAQTSVNSFKNQIKAIRYLKEQESPFIARYYLKIKDSWDQNDTIYMNSYKQNIFHFIKNNKFCSVKTKLELSYKIAKGLCFLYSKQMLHRDFKPQNVVVDANLMPKIIDFGSSISQFSKKSFDTHQQRLLTTPGFHIQYHQIPQGYEYLKLKYTKRKYDQHDLFDVYGFGKTLCFIIFGSLYPPHPDSLRSQPLFQILQNIIFIIQMCFNIDPDDRPGFAEITAFLGGLGQMIRSIVQPKQDQQFATNSDKDSREKD